MGDPNKIIDAYIKIRVDGMEIWSAVPNWRSEKWTLKYKNKKLKLNFRFTDFGIERTANKTKQLIFKGPNRAEYQAIGNIIKKEPWLEDPNNFEYLFVDVGFIVRTSSKKGEFNVGDYVFMGGLLDAYKVSEVKENE